MEGNYITAELVKGFVKGNSLIYNDIETIIDAPPGDVIVYKTRVITEEEVSSCLVKCICATIYIRDVVWEGWSVKALKSTVTNDVLIHKGDFLLLCPHEDGGYSLVSCIDKKKKLIYRRLASEGEPNHVDLDGMKIEVNRHGEVLHEGKKGSWIVPGKIKEICKNNSWSVFIELSGPGINSNPQGFDSHNWYLCNIIDISGRHLKWEDVQKNAKLCGLKTPPSIIEE